MPVDLNFVSYTPTADNVGNQEAILKGGDVGTIQNRALDGDTLTITTEKGTFKFTAPGLEKPENVTTSDMTAALDSLKKLSSGDNKILFDVFQLMSLMQELGNQQRASGREARATERDLQLSEIAKQVEELKSAAMIQMALGIVAGAVSIASGAVQVKMSGSALSALKAGDSDKAQQLGNIGMGWSGVGQGVSGATNAIGTGVSGWMNADATQHQGLATKAGADADIETDFINAMRDLIKDVQDKLQGILQSEADTMKNILRA